MPQFINWPNLVESLWGSPGKRQHIEGVYRLPKHAEDRTSFLRALNLAFREHQPAPADPFSICPTNQEVFKAAVWAIGSNMKPWDKFLSIEPDLKAHLCNYDFTRVRVHATSTPNYVSHLGEILGGQTGHKDAQRIIQWASMLSVSFGTLGLNNYYMEQIQPLAKKILNSLKIFHNSLSQAKKIPAPTGFVLNCDPDYAAEITAICLVAILSNPVKKFEEQNFRKWPGIGFVLGMEFIRNLGWPGFKPDRHVCRLFINWDLKKAYKSMIEKSPAAHFIRSVSGRRLSSEIFHALVGLAVSPPPTAMHPSFSDNLIWLLGSEIEIKGKHLTGTPLYTTSEPTLPHPFYKTKVVDCSNDGRRKDWVAAIKQGIFKDMSAWVANSLFPLGKERVWPKLASLDAVILMPSGMFMKVVETGGVEPVQTPELSRPDLPLSDELASDSSTWCEECKEPPMPDSRPSEKYYETLEWPDFPLPDEPRDREHETHLPKVPIDVKPTIWPEEEKEKEEESKIHRETEEPKPRDPFGPQDREDIAIPDESILKKGPYYGTLILEPYGMYVPSLQQWAKQLLNDGCPEWECINEFIQKNPRNTGPAIILFPDTIATIPLSLKKTIEKKKLKQNGYMPDGCTATMSALRTIFFHELGHHIFSNFKYVNDQAEKVYHEALANWFAHMLLAPWEKKLLKKLSYTQPDIYRAYLGLVFMENGVVSLERLFRLLVNHAYANTLAGAVSAIRSHLHGLIHWFHSIPTSAYVPIELDMAFRLITLL